MNKVEELALKLIIPKQVDDIDELCRFFYIKGYHQAERDLTDKTLDFLKERLYKDGYIGIIDLCDDYIKAMKNG